VDLGELFFCAVTLDADGVAEIPVALQHGRIDSKEAAEIELAIGLDRQAFEGRSFRRV
jgi:hypothetical protein